MNTILNVLLGIALAATIAVLLTGVYSMARGGEFNRKYGNVLMRWRVGLQGCALLLLVLVMLYSGRW
jgi:Hypoxia induced protein conserved region